jgi:NhaP-type Na+/H+ or K+/H+ antiporter
MLGIYVGMYICRFITFFIFRKQIFNYGYGCNFNEYVLLVHGGLKGAVCLSFAMLANADIGLSLPLRDIVNI